MKHATLTLKTDTPACYSAVELRRVEKERARVLEVFSKGTRLLVSSPTPDGKATIYVFEILPIKPRGRRPLGYTPAPPLFNMTPNPPGCGGYTPSQPHRPLASWRNDTAAACTCMPKTKEKDYRGHTYEIPHPESYSTNPADHAANCGAQPVLAAGGFTPAGYTTKFWRPQP